MQLAAPLAGGGRRGRAAPRVAAVAAPEKQWAWQQRREAEGAARRGGGAGGGAAYASTYLEELRIQDFALVSRQTVRFAPGLNAITGESGSGKSVLIEALGQLLGAPAPPECVRAPARAAVVEGTLRLSRAAAARVAAAGAALGLPARALPAADGPGPATLVIRREISAAPFDDPPDAPPGAGAAPAAAPAAPRPLRSRVTVNGTITSVRVLRLLGDELVDTNGQHAAVGLRDAGTQLALLDRIAGNSTLAAMLSARQARLAALQELLRGLDALGDEAERARTEKLVALVDKAGIEPGEERELRARLRSMEARKASLEQSALLRAAIRGESGGGGLLDGLRTVSGQVLGLVAAEEGIMMEEERTGEAGSSSEEEDAAPAPAAANGHHPAPASSNGHHHAPAAGNGHQPAPAAPSGGADEGREEEGDEEEGEREVTGLEHLEASLESLEAARAALAQAAERLSAYAQAHSFSAADWSEASGRLDVIERLMRSQRARSSEALLDAVGAARARLEQYYDAEDRREEWEEEADALRAQLLEDCLRLSAARQAAAGRLRAAVEGCLSELAMGGCRFDVRVTWEPAGEAPDPTGALEVSEADALSRGQARGGAYRLRPQGLDTVEFLLAAGPSEPLRPLAAVASGGESARVMLALKAAPAAAAAAAARERRGLNLGAGDAALQSGDDDEEEEAGGEGSSPVLVLDELDSGVGSRLGNSVGRLLRRMCAPGGGGGGGGGAWGEGGAGPAAAGQVLCVTHLPQVAAHAAHHVVVSKAKGERCETVFQALSTSDARAARDRGDDGNVTRTDSRPIPKNVTLDAGEKPSTMLSSSSKGVGASCVPSSDSYYGPGSGCSESEACCPTTNTCFDRSGGCAAFAARCAPADCGKDMDFKDTECAADVTKYFKKGGVKCSASSDTVCFANATAMALRCSTTSGSAAAAPRMLASLAAAVLALALFMH
ncbi:MAG: P-loop containing nucleoside triphosphate hydrolase protein [Monoraphidium minutum]|nr:MAG: P-loop containing nucleoside triphosphate hydrolase protein [Monoraphidium minutum]